MHYLVSLITISLLIGSSSARGQDDSSSTFSVYQVDAESSDIRLLTYRAGVLSQLGHSHIISVGQLTGRIYVYVDLKQSSFELEIPVRELIIDNPLLRREEGDEFSTVPTDRDIVRTRRNMLGKRVLNAKEYPIVKLTGTGPRSDGLGFELGLSIELLGRVVELSVPTTVHLEGEILEATGAFRLTHSDLGLRPFAAMLGALRVADQMDLKYRVRAKRTPAKD